MDALAYTTSLAQGLFAPALVVMLFYKADGILSSGASKALTEAINDVTNKPTDSRWSRAIDEFLSENFPPKGNPGKFWLSVFVLTAVSLFFLLSIYASQMTSLVDQLLTKGFIQQFLGNGLVIVFIINALAYAQYRHLLGSFSADSLGKNLLWIFADFCAKAILFVVLTAIIYMAFALTTGAFTGSIESALRSVPITIRDALFFRNLTSVYIYSLLLSSFPIFVAIIVKLLILSPSFAKFAQRVLFFFPIAEKPLRASAIIFAAFSALFCLVMSIILVPLLQATSS